MYRTVRRDSLRDSKRHVLSLLIDTLPLTGMLLALVASVFVSLMTEGQLTYFTRLFLVGATCLSLAFGFYNNQRRLQGIKVGTEDTGEIVCVDTCGHTWFSIWHGILTGSLIGIPWFVVLYALSYPIYPFALGVWVMWVLCINLFFPIRYIITTKGVWTVTGTIHSFVHFDDLECIYREPGTRLVWPSDKSNPVVRFSDYVILSIKPERKLLRESQKKHLTPSKPLEFMVHLPQELITRSSEK